MTSRFLSRWRPRRSPFPYLRSFPNNWSRVLGDSAFGFEKLATLQERRNFGTYIRPISSSGISYKVYNQGPGYPKHVPFNGCSYIHTSQLLSNTCQNEAEPQVNTGSMVSADDSSNLKVKRKKLKGKRAVVKWLKFFRWKKQKDYKRMTAEEKILYKLKIARRKEERIVEALKKIEPSDSSEATHDPEILTPEEHFYFLKMGHKCKNYVPVGRRGIFQGVILNMHLHWKKHQTLKVVVKTFTPDEVKEIAVELARLSGGIVLDIHEENMIIMYRGKNYAQPPTEIMSPKVTLSRKKALDKSKYRDGLRAVRKYIPRLEHDLEDLQAQMKQEGDNKCKIIAKEEIAGADDRRIMPECQLESFKEFEGQEAERNALDEDGSSAESSIFSESEDLSDIFETDSEGQIEEEIQRPLYLDIMEKFPSKNNAESEDFEEHLRQIAAASKSNSSEKELKVSELDEIDKIFLRASSLLKKRKP